MMVSNAALRHLGINPKRKDKIEAHFSLDMLEEIMGPLGAAGGTNFIQQIDSFLASDLAPGSTNFTLRNLIDSGGRLSKPMLYRILNSFGYNFTSNSRVRLNITTQLDQLIDLFGNTTWTIKNSQE